MRDRMTLLCGPIGPWVVAAGLAVSLPAVPEFAFAQAAPPPALGVQSPAQPPSPAAPPREDSPGLIDEIGKLFEKSRSIFPPLKSPTETFDELNARARDAGNSLSGLARPSTMVSGRMACPVSANGAPDCKAAADRLCQSKGFKDGKSLDIDAAEKCSPKAYLPGHKREPGDCRTENFVTRALCQ